MSGKHFTSTDRCKLDVYLKEGIYLQKDIAELIGKDESAISREIERNNHPQFGYDGEIAHFKAQQRRKNSTRKTERIENCPDLKREIFEKLRLRWSPGDFAGRWKKEHPGEKLSHETIYLWLYRKHPEMIRYLRHQHKKRKNQKRLGKKKNRLINAKSIEQRPKEVETRKKIGHWEGDNVVGKGRKEALATHVERKSKFLLAGLMRDRSAEMMTKVTVKLFKRRVPKQLRKTLTYDNGSEAGGHEDWEQQLGIEVFFAHPYASCERATNEQTNGMLRWFFPKGMSFKNLTQADVDSAVDLINNKPRKSLNYQTADEVFRSAPRKFFSGDG